MTDNVIPLTKYEKYRKWYKANPEHVRAYGRKYALRKRLINPRQQLLYTARRSAKATGRECTITVKDIIIPDICPLLNIPIQMNMGKRGASSPSIDRIDNNKGYIPGNVWIISWRANDLKSNATLEELKMLTQNLEQKLGEIND